MARRLKQRVKTAKGRKVGSTEWLRRQLNDEYVLRAKEEGYRSRAAFKLIDLDDKFKILRQCRGAIVDLGCAPGSWLQVVRKRCEKSVKIVGIDLKAVHEIEGVKTIQGDFLDRKNHDKLKNIIGDTEIDLVLSDMAADACGFPEIDHLRIMSLVEDAAEFALCNLKRGGSFICKMLQGVGEKELALKLGRHFTKVSFFKPNASRNNSSEIFIVAVQRIVLA